MSSSHQPVSFAPHSDVRPLDLTEAEIKKAVVVQVGVDKVWMGYAVEELALLAKSAGARVAAKLCLRVFRPEPKRYFRAGHLEYIREKMVASGASILMCSQALSPTQEKNLEAFLECRVMDKTRLILDIFAQRAQTREGKLQVELAQLNHLRTRLIRGWTHLERQKGGIGMHGPGESQLEVDRRLLLNRIRYLEKRVDKVRGQRNLSRASRCKANVRTVAMVGYTNAGKSTLFRRLSKDERTYCADKLFATLDPTVRRLPIPGLGDIALVDTVGFISELPHHLVHAFRATLDEVRTADLLLHIIDGAHPNLDGCIADVNSALTSLGADHIPRIDVYNKVDVSDLWVESQGETVDRISVSAQSGAGIDELRELVCTTLLSTDAVRGWYRLPVDGYALRSKLHATGAIRNEKFNSDGSVDVLVRVARRVWRRLTQSCQPRKLAS